MFLEVLLFSGWTSALFLIFALDFEIRFLQAEAKGSLCSKAKGAFEVLLRL